MSRPIGTRVHRYASVGAAVLAALQLAGCVSTPGPGSSTLTIDARNGTIINAQVGDQMLRLKLDPGAPGFVLLNGKAAKALGLGSGVRTTFTVGPVTLVGQTSLETLHFGSQQVSWSVLWFGHDLVDGADGVINPAHVPYDRVVMQLRPVQPGETVTVLKTEFDQERGLVHRMAFGSEVLLTRFTLDDELTTATGATASLVARKLGGSWNGGPFTHRVRYGIRRPVRRMELNAPLAIESLSTQELVVRFRDDLGGHLLPTETFDDESTADNIIVTGAKPRRSFGQAHFWLMVGTKDLSHCSSLTYERRRQRLLLSCQTLDS